MLSLKNLRGEEKKNDQGSTFSLVKININRYINIYYTFYSFCPVFVYYTHVKFVLNEASEQLLQDIECLLIWENFMHVLFFSSSLFLILF